MAYITWWLPEGREPQEHDWRDSGRQALGWVMDGAAINELSVEGTRINGETLLVLLNAHFHGIFSNITKSISMIFQIHKIQFTNTPLCSPVAIGAFYGSFQSHQIWKHLPT